MKLKKKLSYVNKRKKTYKRKKIQKGGQNTDIVYPPESIKNYISNVIYMNLDKRTDRKDQMENQLKIFDSQNVHRVSAVLDEQHGYLACLKSHLIALKMAKDNKYDNVLILEDDAAWANVEKAYPVFEKLVKEPFDVIMLGGTSVKYDHTTYRVKQAQSSASYLVKKEYYDTMIKQCEDVLALNDVNVTPDIQLFWPLQAKDRWLIVAPSLMIQRKSYSDIQKGEVNYKSMFV